MITESGDLAILAVQRGGDDTGPGETVLAEGDTLLLQGTWAALDANLDDPEVLVVDPPELVRRQAVPLGAGAQAALVVLVGDGASRWPPASCPPAVAGPGRRVRDDPARRADASSRRSAASRGRPSCWSAG